MSRDRGFAQEFLGLSLGGMLLVCATSTHTASDAASAPDSRTDRAAAPGTSHRATPRLTLAGLESGRPAVRLELTGGRTDVDRIQ